MGHGLRLRSTFRAAGVGVASRTQGGVRWLDDEGSAAKAVARLKASESARVVFARRGRKKGRCR